MTTQLLAMSLQDLRALKNDRHSAHLFSLRDATTCTDLVELVQEREVRRCPVCLRWLDRWHFVVTDRIYGHEEEYERCWECERDEREGWD